MTLDGFDLAALCRRSNPVLPLMACTLLEGHTGRHMGHTPRGATVLFDAPLEMHARTTDPESSHRAAARSFDSGDLPSKMWAAMGDGWHTCRQIIELIFGHGPFTYEQAVELNKVQTVALKLHREGYLDRRERRGAELQYRRITEEER